VHSLLPNPSEFKKIKNIKNTQIHGLTLEGQSSFFLKNTSKLPFLAQEAQTIFFAFLTVRSCPRLLGEKFHKS
jgi:hypothetical protein